MAEAARIAMEFEAVIGLEVHAELETESKMFCACPVVDPTRAEPNMAVCPVCAGMPGVLPVLNRRAVEYGLRVALALDCEIARNSIFARKNYFYPDLPKGYQISQYEAPLARNGVLLIHTSAGPRSIRIRRVHLEEDTGKLTHISREDGSYSLVDLNRAGIPLLEIVSEPDLRNGEEVRAYAVALRSLLRYLGVNSGDMEKGVLRIEPNISIRPLGSDTFGTRVEIKNLNSLRALERSVAYEIQRQSELLRRGQPVRQETVGWDESNAATFTQRVKEGEDDYRYFPEPDLPPLVIAEGWIEQIRSSLPELPAARLGRFIDQYGLDEYHAGVLVAERAAADYFEQTLAAAPELPPGLVCNWISGELFGLLNQAGQTIEASHLGPAALAQLLGMAARGEINNTIAKQVLAEMFASGRSAGEIVAERDLGQISDVELIAGQVAQVLQAYPEQVGEYLSGKEGLARWLFGKVMQKAKGQANPQVVQRELERQLDQRKASQGKT
jgi:aspartyl-tRNA(Asn)/glutamyl-tRNA(Gln) amidotransferase subunit B